MESALLYRASLDNNNSELTRSESFILLKDINKNNVSTSSHLSTSTSLVPTSNSYFSKKSFSMYKH